LLQSIALLASAARVFAEKCILGLTANQEACEAYVEKSLALATALVPKIGYDRAAALAKKAYDTGKTIREVALAEKLLSEDELNTLLMG
jgi:fumarate hydratase class II